MIEILLTLLFATGAGLFAGLMPGIGSSALMLTSLPILFVLPPELCIIFYAMAVQSAQFSGSVSAINFGMLGELTSYPALAERNYILKNNLQQTALKFTAIGSILSCIVPILCLYPLLTWFQQHSLLLRTEFTLGVMLLILSFCVFYKSNPKIINFFLVSMGVLISQIGLQNSHGAEGGREFLTFDQPFMYQGIPMIVVIGGLIAMPLILKYINWKQDLTNVHLNVPVQKMKFPLFSSIRGGLLGLFTGLIPAVGTALGSNLAWKVEKIFFPRDDHRSVMARLTSAESANNGSQITVLVPLLVLGIAIVPSEMILLSVIKTKSWMPGESVWALGGLDFYQWLILGLVSSSIICYTVCYTFIKLISRWLGRNLNLINKICVLIMAAAVFYAGWLIEARTFFISTFVIFSLVGVYFKRIDFIPLVAGYFIGGILIETIEILTFLYG
jgi:putative tricarboxylic transport membrane protein|tara:strand:+ start:329 stop:1660 length:1332 start_codon:yes stop_codon:yes gene_type:complete